jgi:hypothetical protein
MFYNILLFICVILIGYIIGISIVSLIDKKLSNISINLPKQNIVLDLNGIERSLYPRTSGATLPKGASSIEMFENKKDEKDANEEEFTNYLPPPELAQRTCCENHAHTTCQRGPMNYPDTAMMTPIDRRYFKYNYPNNMTLQDYINWLWLYRTNAEELPYNHLRNLKKLMRGECLVASKGVLPPPSYINLPLNTEQYFNKMYNGDLNIIRPLDMETPTGITGANVGQYPQPPPAERYNKPYIFYPKYGQVI